MRNKKSDMNDSDDEKENKLKSVRLQSALSYCYRILNYKPYTESEISKKIIDKFGEDVLKDTLIKLKNAGLIDDKLYIKLWVSSRVNAHPEGIITMKYRLKKRGISDKLIEEYFSQNYISEEEMVRNIVKKKVKHYRGEKEKLYRYLLQKGFKSQTISIVLKENF